MSNTTTIERIEEFSLENIREFNSHAQYTVIGPLSGWAEGPGVPTSQAEQAAVYCDELNQSEIEGFLDDLTDADIKIVGGTRPNVSGRPIRK